MLSATTRDDDSDPVEVIWTANEIEIGTGESIPFVPADGTHVIVATASDGQGGTATDTVRITVGAPEEPALVGSSTNQGKTWTAIVTSTTTEPLSGAWTSPAGDPLGGCASESPCTLSGIRKNVAYVTFTATNGAIDVLKP